MDYLKSGWKTVVGGPDSPPTHANREHDVADTVEKLVERVETSTLLEDRRDACRALKSLSKTYRLEVGAQAMDALVSVLHNDSNDNEIVTYALDSLNNIISNEDGNQHSDKLSPMLPNDLSIQFTEIFIKRKENVQMVLDLLPEFDFKIRWPTIKLVHSLLVNKQRECQDCILTHPMGISRMMDLLQDPREVIRNDALLLLVNLTRSNANIQKIVAFENAFDRILEIISAEGFSDGGVVVEDCLSILLNLLKNNTSNQNFFKEGSYIQRLLPFFDIPFDANWYPQKISNLQLMFRVIRTLISPGNPLQVTNACQKVLNQSGVLQKLCTILLSNGIPAEILTETINCVAEVIRGNQANQDYFGRVNAPLEPPKPVLVILLMSMINAKQPFELRCAVLYCFQAYLNKNELAQAQVIETLLPTRNDALVDITTGQLLCGGLFSPDVISNWFVAVALSYTLVGNTTQKEQLLRVQLAAESGGAPVSLLAYCSSLLHKGGPIQRRVCLLMFFSTWLAHSPPSVGAFLCIATNIPYLTSQVGLMEGDDDERIVQGLCAFLLGICVLCNDNSVTSFTKDDLLKLITNRIGTEIFNSKLATISKSEKYSQAVQKPQVSIRKEETINFEYEFCLLFKSLESAIQKVINPASASSDNANDSNIGHDDSKLLVQYKELIREQDAQLNALRRQLNLIHGEHETLKASLAEQQAIVQQLRDQNALLKIHKTTMANHSSHADVLSNQLESMSLSGASQIEASHYDYLVSENRRLQSIIDQYKLWEQTYYASGGLYATPSQTEPEVNAAHATVAQPGSETFEIIDTNSDMSQKEFEKLRSDLESSKKELQDLLLVMGDQEVKITRYSKKLKELGVDTNSLYEEISEPEKLDTTVAKPEIESATLLGASVPSYAMQAMSSHPAMLPPSQPSYSSYSTLPTTSTVSPDYLYRPQSYQYLVDGVSGSGETPTIPLFGAPSTSASSDTSMSHYPPEVYQQQQQSPPQQQQQNYYADQQPSMAPPDLLERHYNVR